MTPAELRAAFIADLTDVAPDLDPTSSETTTTLQDDLGLDSMDFLNLVRAPSQAVRPADSRSGLSAPCHSRESRSLSGRGGREVIAFEAAGGGFPTAPSRWQA
jgi:hypothetical protein